MLGLLRELGTMRGLIMAAGIRTRSVAFLRMTAVLSAGARRQGASRTDTERVLLGAIEVSVHPERLAFLGPERAKSVALALRRAALAAARSRGMRSLASEALAGHNGLAESFWDSNHARHFEPFIHWESPVPIQQALNRLISGDPNIGAVSFFLRQHGPFDLICDLGCGEGRLTENVVQDCPGIAIEAYDISQSSLDHAAARMASYGAAAARVSFNKIDLNREALPVGRFDAVMSTGAMHHVENLDFCFANIRRSLKPGGYFFLVDYVGPNRLQPARAHRRMADELLAMVPPKWRLKDRTVPIGADEIEANDPSEAVASQEIAATLNAHFEVERSWARGGQLLATIFGSGCLSAAMEDSADGQAVLRALYGAEQALIANGTIGSDSFLYIGRARPQADEIVAGAYAASLAREEALQPAGG